MSYASVAAKDAPPQSEQPVPSAHYAEGRNAGNYTSAHPDVDSGKVNIVPSGTDLDHIRTESAEEADKAIQRARAEAERAQKEAKDLAERAKKQAGKAEKRVSKAASDASKQVGAFWQKFSSEPAYWASTLGAVNVALLGGIGIYAYANRDQARSWDRRLVSGAAVGILSLLGLQSYAATEAARRQKGKK
ncbi:hypothetical protein CBOM_02383 [Ceraceosorus bombacis]|uniref:Mitochondrial outer membrane protein OM14 C-terminal domain-containing protein n=1 Tax=Ceraceosorus bombacis TaxID=401625 RepID=A0A0P1BFR7_9BASI|nr:hypothetical protein CBOM_02383 [Ceraceosorus bombacis]